MWEYRFIIDISEQIQKTLNQWRHNYDIETLHMQVNDEYVILLIRRKKIEL